MCVCVCVIVYEVLLDLKLLEFSQIFFYKNVLALIEVNNQE